MTLVRMILVVLGCFCLALGTLGMFLPVLPTVPLYLLATLLFAKSSQRLHTWFTNTTLYKKNLESYVKGEGMTIATKLRITCMITISIGIGCYFVSETPLLLAILAVVWLGLLTYFFGFVKTRRTAE